MTQQPAAGETHAYCVETITRLERYEKECAKAALALQSALPIGQVKAIGLLEVAAGVQVLADDLKRSDAALAAAAEQLRAVMEELNKRLEEAQWIRQKLGLPGDATSSKVYGEMHVLTAHAHGYMAYIAAFKCDDKQGAIARLEVEKTAVMEVNEKLQEKNNKLIRFKNEVIGARVMLSSGIIATPEQQKKSTLFIQAFKAAKGLQGSLEKVEESQ